MLQLKASDFDHGSIVDSGIALGNEIVGKLRAGEHITVTFAGMRGLTSSYFNPVLKAIKLNLGLNVIGQRLTFDFVSAAQRAVFSRSLDAVQKADVH